ncbi:MAG: sigma-70 family RNA polymerase sigma factor, partial [Chloroflexota bacterium]|nr:sigma-70 family RNA polymerase sigma factor [Chloroflexota bacterium]
MAFSPVSPVSPGVARDQKLLALMARGDETAFREFYRRHVGSACGLAFRVLRDHSFAQDAVQESFLAVWRQAGSYRASQAKPATWLLTIVHRRAVDLVRSQQRHSSDPLAREGPEMSGIEDEAVTELPTRAWIQEGLARLSDPARQVLELAYFAGLTQVEIAERLDTP